MVSSWPGEPQQYAHGRWMQFFIFQPWGPPGAGIHQLRLWASCTAGAEIRALVGTTNKSGGLALHLPQVMEIPKVIRAWLE